MATTNRTRASMSYQRHWNPIPCALIGVDGVKRRPAVDPLAPGENET